jgi:hypothetical protein
MTRVWTVGDPIYEVESTTQMFIVDEVTVKAAFPAIASLSAGWLRLTTLRSKAVPVSLSKPAHEPVIVVASFIKLINRITDVAGAYAPLPGCDAVTAHVALVATSGNTCVRTVPVSLEMIWQIAGVDVVYVTGRPEDADAVKGVAGPP